MNVVTVERFNDPRYSRPRYRLVYRTRQSWLSNGFTQGSYKLKRDAEFRADELNMSNLAALAKRDGRYEYRQEHYSDGSKFIGTRWVVSWLGVRVDHAPTLRDAYILAGYHLNNRLNRGEA